MGLAVANVRKRQVPFLGRANVKLFSIKNNKPVLGMGLTILNA
jgi:hypothetical protein